MEMDSGINTSPIRGSYHSIMPKKQDTYLRFVLLQTHPDSGLPSGLFQIAYKVKKNAIIPENERKWLEELLDWIDANLDRPDRFNRSSSKGHLHRNSRGISWFKASASDHISKMREIAHILSEHGHFSNEIRTQRPGYIVFEDAYQIVAEPFADTPTA